MLNAYDKVHLYLILQYDCNVILHAAPYFTQNRSRNFVHIAKPFVDMTVLCLARKDLCSMLYHHHLLSKKWLRSASIINL